MSALKEQKATGSEYGLVKLSNASDVTESAGLAVPSSELNATMEGTLKNDIQKLNKKIGKGGFRTAYMNGIESDIVDCNDLPIGYCGLSYETTLNTPSAKTGWIIMCFGLSDTNYRLQIAAINTTFAFRYVLEGGKWSAWKIVATN